MVARFVVPVRLILCWRGRRFRKLETAGVGGGWRILVNRERKVSLILTNLLTKKTGVERGFLSVRFGYHLDTTFVRGFSEPLPSHLPRPATQPFFRGSLSALFPRGKTSRIMQNSIAWPSMIQSSGLLVSNLATLIFPRRVHPSTPSLLLLLLLLHPHTHHRTSFLSSLSSVRTKKCSLGRVHARILPLRQVERTNETSYYPLVLYVFAFSFFFRSFNLGFLVRRGF